MHEFTIIEVEYDTWHDMAAALELQGLLDDRKDGDLLILGDVAFQYKIS